MKKAVKCLISAGPTRGMAGSGSFYFEPFLWKDGLCALAKAAVESGMEVILVSGPVSLPLLRKMLSGKW